MGGRLDKLQSSDSSSKKRRRPEIQVLTNDEGNSAVNCVDVQVEGVSEPGLKQQLLIALYDYESRSEEDIGFKKSEDFVLIAAQDEDWVLVRSLQTKKEGYVPCNYVAPVGSLTCEDWFFGTITRKDSERLLLRPGNQPGCFLIRESETARNSYSLSILNEDANFGLYVKHYRIHATEDDSFFITQGIEFGELKELVEYYKSDANGLCCHLVQCCPVHEVPQTLSLGKGIFKITHEKLKIVEQRTEEADDVLEAMWNGRTELSVKPFIRDETKLEAPLDDLRGLTRLHHPNLVKFFGVVCPEPHLLVWERARFGNLLNYLVTGKRRDCSLVDQIDMAAQIASGMAYLEKFEVVHNALRTSNIMVGNGPVFKVSDYGIHQYRSIADLCSEKYRHLVWYYAPEIYHFDRRSIKSDIWSFAIMIVEILKNGGQPYSHCSAMSDNVAEKIEGGYRMSKPEECPDTLYDILLQCWDKDDKLRPTFEYMQIFLENFFANG